MPQSEAAYGATLGLPRRSGHGAFCPTAGADLLAAPAALPARQGAVRSKLHQVLVGAARPVRGAVHVLVARVAGLLGEAAGDDGAVPGPVTRVSAAAGG